MKKFIFSFIFVVFSASSADYLTSEGIKYHTTEELTQSVKLVSNYETLALDSHCIVSIVYKGKKSKVHGHGAMQVGQLIFLKNHFYFHVKNHLWLPLKILTVVLLVNKNLKLDGTTCRPLSKSCVGLSLVAKHRKVTHLNSNF